MYLRCVGRSLGIALGITLLAGAVNTLVSSTLVILLYPLCFALVLMWLALVLAGALVSVSNTWLAGPAACATAVGADLLSVFVPPPHPPPCGTLGSITLGMIGAAAAPWAGVWVSCFLTRLMALVRPSGRPTRKGRSKDAQHRD